MKPTPFPLTRYDLLAILVAVLLIALGLMLVFQPAVRMGQ
jgi:hypothetical protein